MAQVFWLVRHGEATHNLDGAARGEVAYFDPRHTDSLLTPLGEQQARDCTLPEEVELVCVSPLRRARRTAELVGNPSNAPTVVLPALREFPRGHTPNVWLGEPAGDTWLMPDCSPLGEVLAGSAGALETTEQLDERLAEVRTWLAARKERRIAIVAHGSLFHRLMGCGPDEPFLPHAQPRQWSAALGARLGAA